MKAFGVVGESMIKSKGVFDGIYLVGNGRIADDCLRIMVKKNIPVTYIEIYEETFNFTRKLCDRLGIKFEHHDKEDMKDFLLSMNEKCLIFSVHNSYIFPKEVTEKENITILNMHIAPLPLYRGMNAPTWEIYDQQKNAGVTWHEVIANIDSGEIIVQKKFPIGADDTAMDVLQASFRLGVELFEENLEAFISKNYETKAVEQNMTRLYLNRDLPNEGYIDESWDFYKTYAFLRSMDYSEANIMRLPRVKGTGKIYEITKYRKQVEGDIGNSRTDEWHKNTLDIRWGNYRLICTLREVVDEE